MVTFPYKPTGSIVPQAAPNLSALKAVPTMNSAANSAIGAMVGGQPVSTIQQSASNPLGQQAPSSLVAAEQPGAGAGSSQINPNNIPQGAGAGSSQINPNNIPQGAGAGSVQINPNNIPVVNPNNIIVPQGGIRSTANAAVPAGSSQINPNNIPVVNPNNIMIPQGGIRSTANASVPAGSGQVNPNNIMIPQGGIRSTANAAVPAGSSQINPNNIMIPQGGIRSTANAAVPTISNQSMENRAINGGSSPSNMQSFLKSLNGNNGSNNAMMNTAANAASNQPGAQQAAPLFLGQPATNANTQPTTGTYAPQTGLTTNGVAGGVNIPTQTASNPFGQGNVLNPSIPTPTVPQQSPGNPFNSPGALGVGQIPPPPPPPPPQTFQQSPQNLMSTTALTGINGPAGSNGTPTGVGGLSGLVSDKRAKTNIEDGKTEVKDFLDTIGAHKYEYKDKADGPDTYISPMAQELSKTPVGKSAIVTRPDGKKMVDYGRLSGIMLSAQSTLHQRLANLEKQLKIKRK